MRAGGGGARARAAARTRAYVALPERIVVGAAMPCCVECGRVANATYRKSPTIRMNHCKHCNQLIDKYEEYDFVIIIIDLILHKSQVYRHLIFNRMETYDAGIDPNLVKLAILVIFCDGYIKFSRVRAIPCLENGVLPTDIAASTPVMHVSSPLEFVDTDMLVCVGLATFQLALYLVGIVGAAHIRFGAGAHVKANYLVMCVLASSFGKALYLLMMVWDYPPSFGDMIEWFILSSNIVALRAYFHPDGNIASSAFVVSAGWLTRRMVCWLLGLMCLNTSFCSSVPALA